MKKIYLPLIFVFLIQICFARDNSQLKRNPERTIIGIVIDADSKIPIIGATIGILEIGDKKTNGEQGAVSGEDGRFTLTIDQGKDALVEISYIGHKSQVLRLKPSSQLAIISLQSEYFNINDVVVMGYTTTTREKTVGSISTVNGNIITNSPTDNPISALQGRLPGVSISQTSGVPGSKLNILIRGISTFDSSTEPLIIVDGMPFYNTSISSFDRGIVGEVNPLSSLNPADIERIDVLKDADATAIYGSRGANGVVLITTKRGHEGATKVSLNVERGFSVVPRTMDFLNRKDYLTMRNKAFEMDNAVIAGGLIPNESNAADLVSWDQNAETDWHDLLIGNTAKTTNIQTSISKGSKYTQFLISGGYNNSGSVVLNDDTDRYQRVNGRFNISHMSKNEKFKLNGAMSYSSVITDNTGNSPMTSLNTAPNRPLYGDDGKVYWSPGDGQFGYIAPLQGIHAETNNNIGTFMSTLSLGYELIDNLIAKVDAGYSRTNSSQITKHEDGYHNPYRDVSLPQNSYIGSSYQNLFNLEPQLTYSRKQGDGRMTALVGMTFQSLSNRDLSIELDGFVNPDLMENAGSAESFSNASTSSSEYRFASIFSRLGYEWKDRYFVNGVFRRDGSSRFYTDNKYGNFWSIGGAWIFSKEDMFKDASGIFSFGKIRASYGKTGNDGVGNYQYMSAYKAARYRYNKLLGYYPIRIENQNFSWEENKKLEFGLELAFFNRRLSINTSYYNNRSDNQLVEYPLASQTGFSDYQANLDALVVNRGYEISIMTVNIDRNDFMWRTNFNITIPENELLEFPDLDRSSYSKTYAIGKPLTTEWVYEFDKIDRESGIPLMIDQNNDNVIDEQDRVFKGNSQPDLYGGIGNTFSYKGFELDVFFQFNYQPEARGYLWHYNEPAGILANIPEKMADYWTPENKDASYPGLSTSTGTDIYKSYDELYSRSDAALSNASFLRLKNIAFSYTLPRDFTKKLHLGSVKFYVNAQNLLTFTNFFGWDPETGINEIPPLQTVTFGISLRI